MSAPDPVPSRGGLSPNGAVATSSMSVALVGVIVWVLSLYKITVPPEVIVYFGILASGLGTYVHPAGRSPKAP